MTVVVKIGEDKAGLADLLAKVEGGEDVIIQRGSTPVARMTGIATQQDIASTIASIRAERVARKSTNMSEILEWRDEGRR